MADPTSLDYASLLGGGLMGPDGQFDQNAFQAGRTNAGLAGMAAALMQAGGASRLPVTTGAALGAGLSAYQAGQQGYLKDALTSAQARLYGANIAKTGLEGQVLKNQLTSQQAFNQQLAALLGGASQSGGTAGGAAPANANVAPTAADAGATPQGIGDVNTDGTGIGHVAPKADRVAFIQDYANSKGLNPDAILATINGEGLHRYVGDNGTSFGDFQLHVGGGMGDDAVKAGINIQDPNTWREQAKFAIDQMAANRDKGPDWYAGQWHGAPAWAAKTFASPVAASSGSAPPVRLAQNGPLTSLPGNPAAPSALINETNDPATSAAVNAAPASGAPISLDGNSAPAAPNSSGGFPWGGNGPPPPGYAYTPAQMQQSLQRARDEQQQPALPPSPASALDARKVPSDPLYQAFQKYQKAGGPDTWDAYAGRNASMIPAPADTDASSPSAAAPAVSASAPMQAAYQRYTQSGGTDSFQAYAARNASMIRPAASAQPSAAAVAPLITPEKLAAMEATAATAGPAAAAQVKALRDYAYPQAGYYMGADHQLHPVAGGATDPNTKGTAAAVEAKAKLPFTLGRPGNAVPNANGEVPLATTIQQPGGAEQRGYMTPSTGFQPVPGAIAKLSPQDTSQMEHQGAANVQYGDLIQPSGKNPLISASPMTQDRPSANGSIIPSIAYDALPKSPTEAASQVPEFAKTEQAWNAGQQAAAQAEQRLTTSAKALKMVQSGALTTDKAGVDALLTSLGLPTVFNSPDQVAAIQTALHSNIVSTLQTLKATNPRFAQSEFKVLAENSAHPDTQPGANLEMLSSDLATVRGANQMVRDFYQSGFRNPMAFESAWIDKNPQQQRVDAIKQEIGPLKGMQQPAPASAPTTAGASAPAAAYAVGPNGHILIFQKGQWVDRATLKPIVDLPVAH